MPTSRSARKTMRKSRERHKTNKAEQSRIKNIKRRLYSLAESGNIEEGRAVYSEYSSILDQGVKKGRVKKAAAARRKSRAARRLQSAG
ncbi:MAG: 30S ribosomal protein S20 [Kiritimatiellia bacterium]